jgi:hypothetical protein
MSERSYYFKDGKHYVTGGIIRPMLVNLVDKLAIIPWWVNVPLDTTLNDIVWIREDNESIQMQPEFIEIKSSSSNEKYRITKRIDKYHCTCQGYWRSKDRVCKHIKQVIKENTL